MNRNGKIARLPQDIREQLNRRLQDNEPGDKLLEWLNGQAAVKAVLAEQFEGKAITKQNLSEWRLGGFAEWVLRLEVVYEAQDMGEMSHRLDAVTGSALPDRLATVLAGHYASLLARWDGEVTEAFTKQLRGLGPLCREICALQRGAHSVIKTRIAQERHEMEKEEGRMKNEETGRGAKGRAESKTKTAAQSEPVRPEPMRDYFDPNETWDGSGKEEGRVKNEELGTTVPSEPVAPGQTDFQPNPGMTTPADVATSCRHPEGEAGKEEGRVKNEEVGNSAQSDSVAPCQTNCQPNPEMTTASDVATSCRHPEPETGKVECRMKNEEVGSAAQSESVAPGQTEYKSPITDNRIYEPMAASDPNSGDIYAIDTVPKKRNPDNYDPSPFIYPSYWLWIKMWKPKILPPGHPAKPPVIWNY